MKWVFILHNRTEIKKNLTILSLSHLFWLIVENVTSMLIKNYCLIITLVQQLVLCTYVTCTHVISPSITINFESGVICSRWFKQSRAFAFCLSGIVVTGMYHNQLLNRIDIVLLSLRTISHWLKVTIKTQCYFLIFVNSF